MKTQLQAKIEARNIVNAEHNRLLPLMRAAFAPLVGKKVLKVDGTLLGTLKDVVPACSPAILNSYKLNSNYSLAFVVRACVSDVGNVCAYDEATIYVGNLDGQNLASLIEPQPLPVGYTEAQVLAARAELREAQEALRKAESKLASFGEYDR